jgi:diguanylate cyclase (GGDEF)-like protein
LAFPDERLHELGSFINGLRPLHLPGFVAKLLSKYFVIFRNVFITKLFDSQISGKYRQGNPVVNSRFLGVEMVSGKARSPNIPELEAQLNSAKDRRGRIDALNALAWAINLADPKRSRKLADEAYDLATSGEVEAHLYPVGLAASLRCLAFLNNDAGSHDLALSQAMRAMEILESIPDDGQETSTLMMDVLAGISWTYRCFGDYGVAAEYATKGVKLAQSAGDRLHESGMVNILSVVYAESNNLNAALEMGKRVLECYRELGYRRGESLALNNLALTYLDLGDGAHALETCQESLCLARENGDTAVELTALSTMGEIYLGIQEFERAMEVLLQALHLARENEAGPEEFQCLLNLGKVYLALEKEPDALSAFESALAISHTSNDRPGEFKCHQLLSEVYEKRREFETALNHYKQFHELKETVFNEKTAKRLDGLNVIHQVETAKRDAEIQYLKTIELRREIEERKNAQETLEKLATMDSMTGLLNRREFFMQGEHEIQNAVQNKQPLAAILMDIDHFKQVNDTYGHAAGDQVLIQTARVARESLRQAEIIGRYGGDELVILLPGSSCVQGQQVAERLREKICSQVISTSKGDISITVSVGVAECKETQIATLDLLLELADQALYTAKRGGRNQVAVFNPIVS